MPSSEPYPSAPRRGSTKSLKHNGPMARQHTARSRRGAAHRASLSSQSTGSLRQQQQQQQQQQPVFLSPASRTNSVSIPDSGVIPWYENQSPVVDMELEDAFQNMGSMSDLSYLGAHLPSSDIWLPNQAGLEPNIIKNAPGLEWPMCDALGGAYASCFPSQRSQAIVSGIDATMGGVGVNCPEISVDQMSVHDSLVQSSYLEQSIDFSSQLGGGIKAISSPQTSPSLTQGSFSPVPSLKQECSMPANAAEPALSQDQTMSEQAVSEKAADESGGKQDKNQPIFACPFHRLDPVRHMDCLNRRMTRIRDIKQHLARRHYQHPSHCPTCFSRFVTSAERDEHVQSQRCEPRSPEIAPRTEWVNPSTQNLLKQPASRGSQQTEQWYVIWEILFPNIERPENPFLGTYVEESVGMLKHFWKREGQNVSGWFLENKQKEINKNDLNDIISRLLDEVRAHPYREHDTVSSHSKAATSASDSFESWVHLDNGEGVPCAETTSPVLPTDSQISHLASRKPEASTRLEFSQSADLGHCQDPAASWPLSRSSSFGSMASGVSYPPRAERGGKRIVPIRYSDLTNTLANNNMDAAGYF